MKRLIIILIGLLALTVACSDSSSTRPPQGSTQDTVGVQGNLAGQAAPAASLTRQISLTGDTAVVLVDESGKVVASQVVTASNGHFSLSVPEGHTYLVVFREGSASGRTLGILTPDASGRTTIALPAGSADLDLGDIELDPKTGKARCLSEKSVAHAEQEFADSDGDGLPDVCDDSDDQDGDGVADSQDKYAFDDSESADTDDDGVGDNADGDDDDDGVADIDDALPKDPNETADADNDGIGNIADNDDDNDGVADTVDALPLDPGRFVTFGPATTLAPLAGGNQAAAVAVNEAGLIVGNSEPTPGAPFKAVFWSVAGGPATQLQDFAGAPAASRSAAFGINTSGAIVGEAQDGAGNFAAAFWPSTAAAPAALAPLGAGNTFSAAFGINAGGMIVGEAENNAFNTRAVLWTSSTAAPVDLGSLPGGITAAAYAINDSGVIAGESEDTAGKRHAVAWVPNAGGHAIVDLGLLGEAGSTASSISAAGLIVGESEAASGEIQAMAWLPGFPAGTYSRRQLGTPGIESAANGIAGNRIVGYRSTGADNEAVIWDVTSTSPSLVEAITGTALDSQAYAAATTGKVVGKAGATGFVAGP